jgi:hypothetical protein
VIYLEDGGYGEVCIDLLSYGELALWLYALKEYNKEKKSWWMYPQVGGEPCISCIVMICAFCLCLYLLSALI